MADITRSPDCISQAGCMRPYLRGSKPKGYSEGVNIAGDSLAAMEARFKHGCQALTRPLSVLPKQTPPNWLISF